MKVLSVFGTRPEAIKMAPLVRELNACPRIESRLAVTAQHREMLDQVLHLFDLHPDYDLNVMRPGQTLTGLSCAVLQGLDLVLEQEQPDLVLVHGDTTTTLAAALAAFYKQIPIGHVEAGLRSGDMYAPYPEEMNRVLTADLARLHFAPTVAAKANLLAEGVAPERVFVTGNTVIDALLQAVDRPCDLNLPGLTQVDWERRILLITCHRRENWGQPMQEIFRAIHDLLVAHPECDAIFPLHKNPLVRDLAYAGLADLADRGRVFFCEPLDYLPFCHVIKGCHLVISDSGGLQEEAPALGKPVLVLRRVTERPEAIAAGTARLVGTDYEDVYREASLLLTDEGRYLAMAHAANPYGDGRAAKRICEHILDQEGRL